MVIAIIAFLHVRLLSNRVVYHSTGHHWLGLILAIAIAIIGVLIVWLFIRAIGRGFGRRRSNS